MKVFTIPSLSQEAMKAARVRIDNLTKPCYSLARLETMAEQLAGITNHSAPNHLKHGLLIVAGDHLVDGPQNDSQGTISYATMERFNGGRTATQGAARQLQAPIRLVDVGLQKDTSSLAGVETHKIMAGSHFFGLQPAMNESEFDKAWDLGIDLAEDMHDAGVETLGLGNVGECTFLDALVTTAILTGRPLEALLPELADGPSIEDRANHIHSFIDGLGIVADHLVRGQEFIGSVHEMMDSHNYAKGTSPISYYDNRANWTDGKHAFTQEQVKALLQVAGGPDMVVLTSFVLRAASLRMPIVFDNALTGAAVLAAFAIDSRVRDYVFPAAAYDDLTHQAQLQHLQLTPYLFYNLNVAEGVGSSMGLSIIDASLHMLNDMKTFVEAEVEAAEDGPGNSRQENPTEFDVRKQHGEK